jgi:uncharacterized membrane protein
MYLGGLTGLLLSPLWVGSFDPKIAIGVGSILLIPGGIDGTTQMFGYRESNNRLRAVTGLLLGLGIVVFSYGVIFLLFEQLSV